MSKADNLHITEEFLLSRYTRAKTAGFESKAKWIEFCETLLNDGYDLYLYEARNTYSKYITIKKYGKRFKVRFSNHKPIQYRELRGDCDFFVGITNLSVTTTKDALIAVYNFFEGDK